MMARVSLILSLVLAATSNAFVVQHNKKSPSLVNSPIRSVSSLSVFDPNHICDGAMAVISDASATSSDYIPGTSGEVSYSRASYYTILGLYLLSFPGLFSTISRSTKAKVKRKVFVT
jgi:hypothetical protein